VFYAKADNNKASEPVTFTVRVRGVGSGAAQTAAQGISSAAQSAAAGVSKGVRQGVYVTRVWAAPRLEGMADYTTTTAAPAVDSALRSTAQQIRPVDVTQKKSRSMLTWSLFVTAVLATAGAVAAVVRYRYNNSMTVDADEEFGPAGQTTTQTGTSETAGTAAGGSTAASGSQGDSATSDAGVNGRVSTSGW
jgi:hypothetical protein